MALMSGGEAVVKSLVREGVKSSWYRWHPHVPASLLRCAMSPPSASSPLATSRAAPAWRTAMPASRESPGVALVVPGLAVQRWRRPLHRLRPLLARARHRRPGPPRRYRQESRRHPRGLRSGRHRAQRHQVAAAGALPGGPGGRHRSVPGRCARAAPAPSSSTCLPTWAWNETTCSCATPLRSRGSSRVPISSAKSPRSSLRPASPSSTLAVGCPLRRGSGAD